ncbi:Cyclin-Dependent Kinase [Seminavis robusta]|uniref:Cyclin-Dependent Kinase n=1 Tax=Seminavis robusta TaxID=568900 RepID=A0A9N8E6K8_9STRA|nr:Cyclin-Dependent Kinase [Seminavis robusta]|eukprot:Sro729_g193790.1 Cyclin-Dependent Kinase (466) ;mRNA; r:11053-12450
MPKNPNRKKKEEDRIPTSFWARKCRWALGLVASLLVCFLLIFTCSSSSYLGQFLQESSFQFHRNATRKAAGVGISLEVSLPATGISGEGEELQSTNPTNNEISTMHTNTPSVSLSTDNSLKQSASDFPTKEEEQACKDMSRSIPAFTKAMHDNPEEWAMKTWTQQQWTFPKLDHTLLMRAFGGRNIVFLGDSTEYNAFEWMKRLMNNQTPALLDNMSHMKLKDAIRQAPPPQSSLSSDEDIVYENYNHAQVMWTGFRGTNMLDNCAFDKLVWPKLRQRQPQIILANWGTHMLFRRNVRACNMYMWFHYEEWLDTVLEIAQQMGTTRLLLFKTTNLLCRDKDRDPQDVYDECRQRVQQTRGWFLENDPRHSPLLTDEQLDQYCHQATMVGSSSVLLNERLYRWFDTAQQRLGKEERASNKKLTIAIYNDHDMQSCQAETDGVHFLTLQWPRLRLLAHMVNCLWNDS